jgi:Fe2+ transport system protein FeoA
MPKTLLAGTIATTYNILYLDESPYTTKLINLGLVPGCTVRIVRKAPFGQVFYIKAENNFVALRQEEMACIHIA